MGGEGSKLGHAPALARNVARVERPDDLHEDDISDEYPLRGAQEREGRLVLRFVVAYQQSQ